MYGWELTFQGLRRVYILNASGFRVRGLYWSLHCGAAMEV